ncbi:phage tail tube protein [Robbsia sp. Bb-Pol-6]|uniref:Phage tail tube protein n=1 Tax=Robbsia betulipollinis TaxID=2981849 RepID=A0ABT3ZGJ3_9BURK|nr:phage tail tube protein [Robbsia betulipollinis]MCY0385656.1 phage tail tube protein [Robbsia betulipollinis]
MSTAVSSQGSNFSVNTGTLAAPVWTKIANVKSYSGFDGSATEIDVTDLDSTAKEKRLGLQDNGSFSIEINVNYADPGQAAMQAARAAGTSLEFKLGLPTGTAKTFNAFVKTFPLAGGTDTVLTATVALTITGAVTDVPASS